MSRKDFILIAGLLSAIWDRETDNPVERPNFQRIVKDSCNNVRDCLSTLEVEILAAYLPRDASGSVLACRDSTRRSC
jgi:hypothetical protein